MLTTGQLSAYKLITKALSHVNLTDYCHMHLAKLRVWESIAMAC